MNHHLRSVVRLLKTKGNSSWSLRKISNSSSSNSPDDIVQTYTTQNIQSFRGKYKSAEVNNTTIKQTDIKLYVDPTGISCIGSNDRITDGTNIYTIEDIEIAYYQDTVILYTLQLRK